MKIVKNLLLKIFNQCLLLFFNIFIQIFIDLKLREKSIFYSCLLKFTNNTNRLSNHLSIYLSACLKRLIITVDFTNDFIPNKFKYVNTVIPNNQVKNNTSKQYVLSNFIFRYFIDF